MSSTGNNLFITNLTIADGQLATVATQIVSGPANNAQRLNITMANVGGLSETIILTISRNGGTQRRLKMVVLDTNEAFEIVGLPLNLTDVLYASTTDANSVDYVVSLASTDAPLSMYSYDANGRLKTAPYILEQMDAIVS